MTLTDSVKTNMKKVENSPNIRLSFLNFINKGQEAFVNPDKDLGMSCQS